MLENEVDPNFVHSRSSGAKREMVTPLHVAVDIGNFNVVDALLAANADCNIKDHNEDCPLHVAVIKADVSMTKYIHSLLNCN